MTRGAIPIVKRTGPYAFDQVQKRKIHSRMEGRVKYETFQYYHFNVSSLFFKCQNPFNFKEKSSCDECFLYNRIWIPNLVYQKFVEAASKPSMKVSHIFYKFKILFINLGGYRSIGRSNTFS